MRIVVGQRGVTARGEDSSLFSGGGGGGSFVVKTDGTILVIAGGGGGGSGDCATWNPVETGACISASTGPNGGFTFSNGMVVLTFLFFYPNY